MTTINRETWMTIRDDPHKIGELVNSDNVNAPLDENGTTPLMLCENAEVAKLLIERGAKVDATDNSGKSVTEHCHRAEVVQVLIEKGAIDIKKKLEDAILYGFHSLFYSKCNCDYLRHWCLDCLIQTDAGWEVWWNGELCAHLQRANQLSGHKNLIVFSQIKVEKPKKCLIKPGEQKNKKADLLLSEYELNKKVWEKYSNNKDEKKYFMSPNKENYCIPIELKYLTVWAQDDYRFFEKNIEEDTPYKDAWILHHMILDDIAHPFCVQAVLVTGKTKIEKLKKIYDEIKEKARQFVPFPSDEDRRLILDEEICIKADPSQPVDDFTGITSAHQFVWIIKRKQRKLCNQ